MMRTELMRRLAVGLLGGALACSLLLPATVLAAGLDDKPGAGQDKPGQKVDEKKTGEAKPGESAQGTEGKARDELVELIRARAVEAQKKAKERREREAAERAAQAAQRAAQAQEQPAAGQPKQPAPGPVAQRPGQAQPGLTPTAPGQATVIPAQPQAEGQKGCGSTGDVDTTPPPPDAPQPKLAGPLEITTDPTWAGQKVSVTFNLRNEGEGPLAINLKKPWGATISGPLGRIIEPGAEEPIQVEFAVGAKPGDAKKSIRLETNDPKLRTTMLTASTKVLLAAVVDPPNAAFGVVQRDAGELKQTIHLRRADGGALAPEIAPGNNPNCAAVLREITPGEHYEIDVTIRPPWPNGPLRDTLRIGTGVKEQPFVYASVFANVLPRLTANPNRLMLRAQDSGAELRSALRWSGDPAHVTEVTVNDPALSVRLEDAADGPVVVLQVPENYHVQQNAMKQIVLKTDDPAVPTFSIPIHVSRVVSGQPVGGVRPAGSVVGGVSPTRLTPVSDPRALTPGSQAPSPGPAAKPDPAPKPAPTTQPAPK